VTVQRIDGKYGHWYKIDGTKADGVTTLIKNGLPKPALIGWAARTVAEYVADATPEVLATLADLGRDGMVNALKGVPWKKRDDAAAKGTEVHRLAEHLVRGDEVEVPEQLAGYVDSCLAFFDDWKVQPVAVERTIANRRWRYCGTFDLVADAVRPDTGEAVRGLFDYKTSGSGIWPDVALQFAAYANAEVYVAEDKTERPMADILPPGSPGFGVWLRADGYDVYPVDMSEPVYKTFLHVAYVARKCDEKTGDIKSWLSPAIQPATLQGDPS